jgi:uncharacterized protein YjbJ (UPF0337 family)
MLVKARPGLGFPKASPRQRPPSDQEEFMNWDTIEGNWKKFTGNVKEQWGKLTDDDITRINGNREQLEGMIQERYGVAKDKAKEQVDSWMSRH